MAPGRPGDVSMGRASPRLRRLRRAAWLLVLGGVVVAVSTWVIQRRSRPETYRPGEEHAEITRDLARGLPAGAPQPRFHDVTEAAGLSAFRTFAGDRSSQLPEDMGPGAAWGDYDDDGDDDLLLVSAGGPLGMPEEQLAPTLLYENRGDGRFREAAGFPETRMHGMGAAWGDYDGDGRLDLVLTGYGTLRLFHNRSGAMVRVDALPDRAGFWAGAVWGDFDNDRDLDLYVCGYVRYKEDAGTGGRTSSQFGQAVPYTLNPASYEPERNLLFRNEGGGRFSEVAEALGVANPEGRSLGALWHDFDGDGWLDLYVANDVSDNVLYMNRAGRFEDRSHAAWVADYRGAMGLAAGDWNGDGDDDLFITHWVAQENALYDSLLEDLRPAVAAPSPEPSPARPARQGLTFADQAALTGLGQVALAFVGWGTEFADLDADGRLDLLVANGSTFETETEPRRLVPQRPFLFWNRGDFFHDLAPLAEPLSIPAVGRGLALSDYDNDGDLDVLFVHLGAGVQLLRNDMQAGRWIELRLRSRTADGAARGFGDGATVVARAGTAVLRRTVSSASYLSQSSRRVHIGLGTTTALDSVEVRWLGGRPQTFTGLEAGALWELTEGEPAPRRAVSALARQASSAEFWTRQRAAMEAMKRERDLSRAVTLFREALALDPNHEEARYYLANSLETLGQREAALAELSELVRINPRSHRAHKQWGVLRAASAASRDDLEAAREALERARAVNPEETGTLLLLGEVALLMGERDNAGQLLEWACRTNPRAVGGFFLRAYLAWKDGDRKRADELLARAGEARGEDWKPAGTTAEGDASGSQHREITPLLAFWSRWDPQTPLDEVFEPLDAHLRDPFKEQRP